MDNQTAEQTNSPAQIIPPVQAPANQPPPPAGPPPSKSFLSNKILLLIIGILILILASGAGLYLANSILKPKPIAPNSISTLQLSPTPITSNNSSQLSVFSGMGISFSYPKSFVVIQRENTNVYTFGGSGNSEKSSEIGILPSDKTKISERIIIYTAYKLKDYGNFSSIKELLQETVRISNLAGGKAELTESLIGGKKAYMIKNEESQNAPKSDLDKLNQYTIPFEDIDSVIQIYVGKEDKNLQMLDQIISTFKFVQ